MGVKAPITIEAVLECNRALETELSKKNSLISTILQGRTRDRKKLDEVEAENRNLRRRLIVRDHKATVDRLDVLTNVLRRSAFTIALAQMCTVCIRKGFPLTLLFMDIDHFKEVNDVYGGHDVGDRMLRKFSKVMRSSVRDSDLVGRWGGEEFVIALFDTDLRSGIAYAENLRGKFEEELRIIGYQGEKPVHVRRTVSIGVASLLRDESPEAMIRRADNALYQAKSTGRNKVFA